MSANDKRQNINASTIDTTTFKIGGTDKTSDINSISGKEASANKDASGGYAGLTLFKINFKNVANTIVSFFTNSNTVARTYTFQDRNGIIADDTDLASKVPNSRAINGLDLSADRVFTQDNIPDGTTYKQYSDTEKTKLATVATGATANSSDATLLSRANHTGAQTASTISDFNAAALAAAPAETSTTVGGLISGATEKTIPVDADKCGISDSAASNVLKYLTFANLKAAIKSYIDSLTTTFTNKRITPRVSDEASNATPSINTDNFDAHEITDLAANASITLSGTPTRGQRFRLSIKDNGTSRTITWPSNTEDSSTANRPTTTTVSVRMDVGLVWNVETSKWRCIAVA